jgi:hypothetical protein
VGDSPGQVDAPGTKKPPGGGVKRVPWPHPAPKPQPKGE